MQTLHRIFTFLLSGGLATLLHFAVMAALVAVGEGPLLATLAGSLSGALLNYLLQYHWAFRSQRRHHDAIIRYVGWVALGWALNGAFFFVLHSTMGLSVVAAQLSTTVLLTMINYSGYRRLVFA